MNFSTSKGTISTGTGNGASTGMGDGCVRDDRTTGMRWWSDRTSGAYRDC